MIAVVQNYGLELVFLAKGYNNHHKVLIFTSFIIFLVIIIKITYSIIMTKLLKKSNIKSKQMKKTFKNKKNVVTRKTRKTRKIKVKISKACKTQKKLKVNRSRKNLKKQTGGEQKTLKVWYVTGMPTDYQYITYENTGDEINNFIQSVIQLLKYLNRTGATSIEGMIVSIKSALRKDENIDKFDNLNNNITAIESGIRLGFSDTPQSDESNPRLAPVRAPMPLPTATSVRSVNTSGTVTYASLGHQSVKQLPNPTGQYAEIMPKSLRDVSTFLSKLPSSNMYAVLVIDIDTVLKPTEEDSTKLGLLQLFEDCFELGEPGEARRRFKDTCKLKGETVTNFKEYFYDYDYLKRLLSALATNQQNSPYVFFASNRYDARQIIPAFIGINQLETDILIPLLRGNDRLRITEDGSIKRQNPGTRQGDFIYEFLEKYFITTHSAFPSSQIISSISGLLSNTETLTENAGARARAGTVWQKKKVYVLTSNDLVQDSSDRAWEIEVKEMRVLSDKYSIIMGNLSTFQANSAGLSEVNNEGQYGVPVRGLIRLENLDDIVDNPPDVIVIDLYTLGNDLTSISMVVRNVEQFLEAVLCKNTSRGILPYVIIASYKKSPIRKALKQILLGNFNAEIAAKLVRGDDTNYLKIDGQQTKVKPDVNNSLSFFDKYIIAYDPESEPITKSPKGLTDEQITNDEAVKSAIRAKTVTNGWFTETDLRPTIVFITTSDNTMTAEPGYFDILKRNFKSSDRFEIPPTCIGSASPPAKRPLPPLPPPPQLPPQLPQPRRNQDPDSLLYLAFKEKYPTEADLDQKEFDLLKIDNKEYPVHLVNAYDIFLFDFDKTITMGCVDTRKFPITKDGVTQMNNLTTDYLNFIIDGGQEIQAQFIDTLFGLQNGYFFAKFIRYLAEKDKKFGIVTLGPSDVIHMCLQILFDFLHQTHGKGLFKTGFKNPFYNPYDDKTYAGAMGDPHSVGAIYDKKADDSGNSKIYKSGVILSLHSAGLNGNAIVKNSHTSAAKMQHQQYKKNKMLRRLVFDLSGMSGMDGIENVNPDNDTIKKTWFTRTIYFDDDPSNIEALTSEQVLRNYPDNDYLKYISGIKLGQIKLKDETDELNLRALNNTVTYVTSNSRKCQYNGFGISVKSMIKIQQYLSEKYTMTPHKPRETKTVLKQSLLNVKPQDISRVLAQNSVLFSTDDLCLVLPTVLFPTSTA
jgi:hypothetical protein